MQTIENPIKPRISVKTNIPPAVSKIMLKRTERQNGTFCSIVSGCALVLILANFLPAQQPVTLDQIWSFDNLFHPLMMMMMMITIITHAQTLRTRNGTRFSFDIAMDGLALMISLKFNAKFRFQKFLQKIKISHQQAGRLIQLDM
ncbi:hypothetical protein T4C_6715 [Trichinella pseudospiralis]|uniref:Uncharacterized protein n=1 Tax=Trichinella pseudospiralis TaxID=6337 RepID=A0A0V1JP48_TRIPS|nr:hypothetical protein T4C_6715 [Trichinella pseudospiralis]